MELRLPHRAAVLGSSMRTEDTGGRRCSGEQEALDGAEQDRTGRGSAEGKVTEWEGGKTVEVKMRKK